MLGNEDVYPFEVRWQSERTAQFRPPGHGYSLSPKLTERIAKSFSGTDGDVHSRAPLPPVPVLSCWSCHRRLTGPLLHMSDAPPQWSRSTTRASASSLLVPLIKGCPAYIITLVVMNNQAK